MTEHVFTEGVPDLSETVSKGLFGQQKDPGPSSCPINSSIPDIRIYSRLTIWFGLSVSSSTINTTRSSCNVDSSPLSSPQLSFYSSYLQWQALLPWKASAEANTYTLRFLSEGWPPKCKSLYNNLFIINKVSVCTSLDFLVVTGTWLAPAEWRPLLRIINISIFLNPVGEVVVFIRNV